MHDYYGNTMTDSPQVFDIKEIIGFTGFSILATQSIPSILNILKDHLDLNVGLNDTAYASMCINITSGSLILAYGVLMNDVPVISTIPVMIFLNLLGLCVKLYFTIKQNRGSSLY